MSGHPDRPEAQVRRPDRLIPIGSFWGPHPSDPKSDRNSSPRPCGTRSEPSGPRRPYIERGGPWKNGFIESFNARLRDELLDGKILYSLAEAKILIESWRRHYNAERPDGSLGYKPPAPEVFIAALAAGGFATPTRAAARASREPNHHLTFAPDQSLGADQFVIVS
jgi:hypothetical protein